MSSLAALLVRNGQLINQSVSAAVAIISGSFLLYSLAKDIRSRVARAFSLLLAFVTITYIGDLGVSYSNSLDTAALWLRFQWLGIAFAPASYIHLSDAILTMTGIPSRGRRRWTVRSLYLVASIFLLMVVWTDWLVRDPVATPAPHFSPGPAFWVYVAYFASSLALSMWFVIRARRRTLTEVSRRRLTYLLIPYIAPALAVFPFLLITGPPRFSTAVFYAVLIVFDTVLAVMLTFMAYPLAFFGSLQPDRLIKAQMLQFFLRGPLVAIVVLEVIYWVPRASGVLGLPGDEVMPVLAVMTILACQWAITLVRPYLERLLIYIGDYGEMRRIQELEARLLTGADFRQLLDSILTTLCDYLQVKSAFVASISLSGARLEQAVGLQPALYDQLANNGEAGASGDALPRPEDITPGGDFLRWRGFWLIPLHFSTGQDAEPQLVGLLGVAAPIPPDQKLDEERWQVLMALAARCAEVLEDRRLQSEVFAALEGILPEIAAMQQLRGAARYGGVDVLTRPLAAVQLDEDFAQKIKDALTHYWGGPNLTEDSLMSMAVVQQALDEHGGNPQRAMRAVLQQAIERLKPEGQRSMTTTEWILYNILEMRFIQGRKVRDVALRLAMSESDLYRKQRVAIEAVAGIILSMDDGSEDGPQGAESEPAITPR
jgi:N-terminal 7TM region of histidine kinase